MAPSRSFLTPLRGLAVAAALSQLSLPAHAQTPAAAQPKDPVAREAPQTQAAQTAPGRARTPDGVALSPDGQLVAWTLRGKDGAAVHLTSATHPDPGTEKLITVDSAASCAYTNPIWSPDGQTLAFLSDCAPPEGKQAKGQLQIFLWSKNGGQVRQLSRLTGAIQQPAWSPDGKAIAFLFVENASRSAGALDAMKPYAGVIGEDWVEIQRVFAVDSNSGHGTFLTTSNLHVYEFDWAPSSHQIAFIAANPPGENNWWVAKLYKTALSMQTIGGAKGDDVIVHDSHLDTTTVLDPSTTSGSLHGLQIAVPRFSPDGKQIAFIGGLMSDQGSTGGDLYTVPANGGQPTDITPGIDGTPSYEAWLNNDTLGFVEDRRGHTLIVPWDVTAKSAISGATQDLGEVSVGGGPIKDAVSSIPNDGGAAAFTLQSFNKPPEVYSLSREGLQQLTHLNDSLKPAGRTESVEWTDGPFHVQGWLTFPAHYDPAHKYPVIVSVHGGPSASITARWSSSTQISWADRGYFELQPNPRGSFGQGEAFTEANRKDFGYGDLHDIEAGLDFVESKYAIDHDREGLTGWSYGGFMTMFAVTQTHRFKAAVAGAGLSDWLSYYGENSIDQWMLPFFGASVYDDPAVYAKSSAITYIKNVKTPTLVIVGDRDGECPAPQSFEFWHALRDLGVKTQLVVYPNEGHGFRDPEHIRDRAERTAKWFDDNMRVGAAR